MKMATAFILMFLTLQLNAQERVIWSAVYEKSSSHLLISAKLEPGWHIYSQNVDEMAGPVPTSFEFDLPSGYQLVEKVEEPKGIVAFDENFESELKFFEKYVVFSQKISGSGPAEVKCIVTFMTCNEETCYPPEDKELFIKISN
jgi:hypothetical protein